MKDKKINESINKALEGERVTCPLCEEGTLICENSHSIKCDNCDVRITIN